MKCLQGQDVFPETPCGGKGRCGKCRVRILEGVCSPITEEEARLLKETGSESGIRLACMTTLYGMAEIEPVFREGQPRVLVEGYLPPFQKISGRMGYGVAADVGTTTIAISLVDLSDGSEAASASAINMQTRHGADVLTRITYESEHPGQGRKRLQSLVVESLNRLMEESCRKAGVSPEQIREITVAANTTMMHMLLGADAKPLGRAPYRPSFSGAQTLFAAQIGLKAAPDALLYCLPFVSAYIGADIVAGAYVGGLQEKEGNVLFLDLGTNAEMVLSYDGRLLCCSCAAGPALEGMNITCGMRAAAGAIEDARISPDGVRLTTIGGEEPRGLCGSGILSAVKELLRTGLVGQNGALIQKESLDPADFRYSLLQKTDGKKEVLLCKNPEIKITQQDIRQVQLSKGAILSGCTALLRKAGVGMEDLDQIQIAGQFGASLPAQALIGCGILPKGTENKLFYLGNASKSGAYLALVARDAKRRMEALAHRMESVELAETGDYERLLAKSMIFPDCRQV